MKLPEELRMNLEEISNQYKEVELKNAYIGISDRYMNEKRKGSTLLSNEIDVISYANARMPATYSAVYSALKNSYEYIKDIKITSLLDVGAGTGAATWAAKEILELDEITCIEREENMLKFRKKNYARYKFRKSQMDSKRCSY